MPTKGQCLCGAVTVSVDKPLPEFDTLICHCTSCKRRSGGIASYAFMVPKQHVTVSSGGEPSTDPGTSKGDHVWTTDNDTTSGNPMQRSMCRKCGSPVCIVEAHAPEIRCLQYGLFAGEVELPKPKLEFFRKRACAWVPEVGESVREEM